MSKVKLLAAVVVLLIIGQVILAYVAFKPKKEIHPRMDPVEHFKIKLDLDQDQVTQLKSIIDNHVQRVQETRNRGEAIKKELNHFIKENNPGVEDSLFQTLGDLQVTLESSFHKHLKEIYVICNEKQKAKLITMLNTRHVQRPPPPPRLNGPKPRH